MCMRKLMTTAVFAGMAALSLVPSAFADDALYKSLGGKKNIVAVVDEFVGRGAEVADAALRRKRRRVKQYAGGAQEFHGNVHAVSNMPQTAAVCKWLVRGWNRYRATKLL